MFEGLYETEYWLSRFVIQRGIGLMYLIAFIVAINQFRPLLGEKGLLPVPQFLSRINFKQSPSIFHWHYSNRFFSIVAWIGLTLSILATTGISDSGSLWFSILIWFLLWVIYLSIVNVGQLFYGYGWESLLLEAGFYMIFMGPMQFYAPVLVIFIIRWLVFRVEFGAGLIKMRGDECWRNLTCLNYHHETQPMPNPLSRFFHHLPERFHKMETFFNHCIQLGVVWLLFFPQPIASIAAVFIILSQLYLIISGNYAWLNYLTLILAFSGIGDEYLQFIIPVTVPAELVNPLFFQLIIITLTLLVAYMSIGPVKNMLSSHQRMNASFNPLHLVNTYGAFGSVSRKRYEIIIEGTTDENITDQTEWKAYEFKGKPGDPGETPPQIAPYHFRLDWQMWFAAMTSIQSNPWLIRLIRKLLENNQSILKLLKSEPFNQTAPNYIRASLFQYEYTTSDEQVKSDNFWKRTFVQNYLPPQSLNDLKGIRF